MIIAHVGCRLSQKIRMDIHRFHNTAQHQKKLNIFMGGFSRVQKVDPVVGDQRPVVVLAGTVDPRKRLLVEKAGHTVAARHLFQGLHDHLVVIHRQIRLIVDGSQLMLSRGDLVVLSLGSDAQLPQLLVHLFHVSADSLPDSSEIMIFQLLTLGRHGPEQGTPCIDQIFPLQILGPVNEEILLLRPHGGNHPFGCGIAEQPQDPQRLCVNGLHGAQQRGFLIQGLAGVGRGDTQGHSQGIFPEKRRGCAVPHGIASCLESGSQAS